MRASPIQILCSVRSELHPPRRLRPVAKTPKEDRGTLGWAKTIGGMAQTVLRGIERAPFALTMVACNLAKLPKLGAV